MRKLVTVRKVKAVEPIANADRIEKVVIDGWKCVSKKDEFAVGDYGVYFEIDSFLPVTDDRFSFLLKQGTKTIVDFEGIRIRTQKFRGELSQGLFLPLTMFPEIEQGLVDDGMTIDDAFDQRIDFTELLGIRKYERPEPQTPDAAGPFPAFIRKTDEERIQNVYDDLCETNRDVFYYPTLKLDGTSCTIATVTEKYEGYYNSHADAVRSFEFNGEVVHIIVCSRTLQIKTSMESHYVASLERMGMFEKIEEMHRYFKEPIAVQGECIGYGIQGNPEKLPNHQFFAFNIFAIDPGEYMPYTVSNMVFDEFGVTQVPVLGEAFCPFREFSSVDDLLAFSDGPSLNANVREGIVYKSDRHGSFKAISNQWLINPDNA